MRRSRSIALAVAAIIAASGCASTPPTETPASIGSSGPGVTSASGPVGVGPSGAPGSPLPQQQALPPSRRELIAQALAAGRIDHVTSLRYRGAALFKLPELPEEFALAPSRGDDSALFDEIVDLLPSLSPADQQRLRPFVVRPTEPDSIFAGDRGSLTAGLAGGSTAAATGTVCRDWVDSAAASTHFKVWACKGGDAAAAARDIGVVAAVLDEIWTPMTKAPPSGMGPPIADAKGPNFPSDVGGDARIDVYLLAPGEEVDRGGRVGVPTDSVAAAVPAPPYHNDVGNPLKTSSGFILVDRSRLADRDDLKRDVIHEFFHVLQKAHNRTGMVRGSDQHWFGEATATWAETFYFRERSAPVHTWFSSGFQLTHEGLEAISPEDNPYEAYIWPLFMEQEAGGGSPIFKAWVAIQGAASGDWTAVSNAIDAQLPFAKHFRDFAVRNLNRDLTPVEPAQMRYVELDRAFPDGVSPVPIESGTISQGRTYRVPTTIEPLAARYFYLVPDFDVRDVTIDLAELRPAAALDGDVLLHIKDRWERRPIEGGRLRLCRDDPKDDFDQLHLVLSDHSREQNDRIQGDLIASGRASCGDLAGTITWTLSETSSSKTFNGSSTDTVSLSVRFDERDGTWVDDGSSYSWSGSGQSHSDQGNCSASDTTTTTTGGGPFEGSLASTISVDVDHASKEVAVYAWVAGLLQGHVERQGWESNGGPEEFCVTRPHDYSQGGGNTIDSQAEWGQVPRCVNEEESVKGKISADGKTATFSCSNTVTNTMNIDPLTVTTTMTVSGQLTFSRRGS